MQDTRTEALYPLQKNIKKVLATTIGGGSMALFHYWVYGLLEKTGDFKQSASSTENGNLNSAYRADKTKPFLL
jgi:hypothetical protein